ncbi:hypothetical protein JOC78_001416 [Bacillus ectoiniformans]|uniref:hypothetical protein n=1 Tax=Bacillus ectoiniformans TaxID=1494429 RepID=UPI00195C3D72|nr:hypothetical protein [Bacillus ectoiniformans]MBM7648470.1 hypothetical protein [Bacillus ectoiniformans]
MTTKWVRLAGGSILGTTIIASMILTSCGQDSADMKAEKTSVISDVDQKESELIQ